LEARPVGLPQTGERVAAPVTRRYDRVAITRSGTVEQAERAVLAPLAEEAVAAEQFTFLGTGWTVGLANEAALKLRQAAGAWTESYPATAYRHGPIGITGRGRIVWFFGAPPTGLVDEVRATGAYASVSAADPLAELVRAQRLAVALADRRGLDPHRPRNLTRSVVPAAAGAAS
jgi:fructoselysine-6-P-deglycase FrlB-like protein